MTGGGGVSGVRPDERACSETAHSLDRRFSGFTGVSHFTAGPMAPKT